MEARECLAVFSNDGILGFSWYGLSCRNRLNARRERDLVVVLHEAIEHIRYEDDEVVDVGILECTGQFDFAGRVHAPIAELHSAKDWSGAAMGLTSVLGGHREEGVGLAMLTQGAHVLGFVRGTCQLLYSFACRVSCLED